MTRAYRPTRSRRSWIACTGRKYDGGSCPFRSRWWMDRPSLDRPKAVCGTHLRDWVHARGTVAWPQVSDDALGDRAAWDDHLAAAAALEKLL